MGLVLPQEIVTERVLPTLRTELATALLERGWTQRAVAEQLGVTQAAVSGYASGKGTVDERLTDDPRFGETVDRLVEGFDSDDLDEYEAMAEIIELIRSFEDRGPICAIHEAEMPALEGLGCDICVRGADDAVAADRETLANVRRATRMLQTSDSIGAFVPNAGTNLGMARPNPIGPADVAAIPGRIHSVRGRIEVPGNPEFGASEHVSRMILAANEVDPTIRAACNLRTDDRLLEAARERGFETFAFDADYEDRTGRLRSAFETRATVPRVVYHEGAFGIEPIAYVLGESAVSVVDVVADLVTAETEP
ncbi:thiamine-phosphate synthase family protein [Natronococcus sp. A-GB1]|uniref:thiamine-phosphate synthase family protein n=1 Tax=Natronococcus sp. A-GB1 TaxID=3037648 RepID=UPI00241D595C|nr:thiamine-phosphate synthase family protein [Natronococcus sp. A-GB1]MDG5760318.1 thiamine-phosphate synthase family protein [Natronococcus sp. A-GB1]